MIKVIISKLTNRLNSLILLDTYILKRIGKKYRAIPYY